MSEWADIPDFPEYVVNINGRVASDKTGTFLSTNYNQQGVANVGMYKDGRIFRRSVAVMVAEAFVPRPEEEHFDTPIHLDGDRTNCHAHNLAWRPRWFAVKYHQQFNFVEEYESWKAMPIVVMDTGEFFEHTIDCCIKYGMLYRDVVPAALNGGKVFPHWFSFRTPDREHAM